MKEQNPSKTAVGKEKWGYSKCPLCKEGCTYLLVEITDITHLSKLS